MELAVFLIFAFLALASAVVVVLHRNPVYSVMSLVVTLISLAVLFVLLGAPFIAALQVLVYTGAILVLFLFVLMLLNVEAEAPEAGSRRIRRWVAVISATTFSVLLGVFFWSRFASFQLAPLTREQVSVRALAAELFSTYLLPFEIIGLLLLAAVVAATMLARKPSATREESE